MKRGSGAAPASDALFSRLELLQGRERWGSFLDAGTGLHSLRWVSSLSTERWTAVTADPATAGRLERELSTATRAGDRIVTGDWRDPLLLHGEAYDTVLADYVLGAIDGFAPHFQDRLFARLRPLVRSRLYVIGLEPYPDESDHPWGRVILDVARLRDASILLAAHRCYREYPLDWVLRRLEESGLCVEDASVHPIRYGPEFIREQIDVSLRKLPFLTDRKLASHLERAAAALRDRALALHALHGATPFGEDYVVLARPRERRST